MDAVLATGRAQRSVHYESRTRPGDPIPITTIADVGRGRGVQRNTVTRGGRTGHITIVVNAKGAFVRGDAVGLNIGMGYREAASARTAGRWIRIPRTDGTYAAIADAVTLGTEINDIEIYDPQLLGGPPSPGQHFQYLRGTTSHGAFDACVLKVRVAAQPLPVREYVPSAGSGEDTFTTVFSRWNEPLRLPSPSHWVDIGKSGLRS
jgi:hypothetical protein